MKNLIPQHLFEMAKISEEEHLNMIREFLYYVADNNKFKEMHTELKHKYIGSFSCINSGWKPYIDKYIETLEMDSISNLNLLMMRTELLNNTELDFYLHFGYKYLILTLKVQYFFTQKYKEIKYEYIRLNKKEQLFNNMLDHIQKFLKEN
jgi:hypothetical protein